MPQWAGKLLVYAMMAVPVLLLVLLIEFVVEQMIGG